MTNNDNLESSLIKYVVRMMTNTDNVEQGRIQDLIGRGGGPDRDRPKTAILGPQFCRILVLGPHFWWLGGPGPQGPPGSAPVESSLLILFIIRNLVYVQFLLQVAHL